MVRTPRILLATFLLAFSVASQGLPVAAWADGSTTDFLVLEGSSSWVTTPDRVKTGVAAPRVAPGDSDFFGITYGEFATLGAASVLIEAFLEGDEPARYRVRVDDVNSGRAGKDAFIFNVDLTPGWNIVKVPLKDTKSGDGRAMDFATAVRKIQISKRKEQGDVALTCDGVRLEGATAAARGAFTKALTEEKDGAKRARFLRENLALLSEQDRVSVILDVLKSDRHPRARRAARESLSTCGTDESAAAVAHSIKGTVLPDRPELVAGLGSMPSRSARLKAEQIAADPKADSTERTAAISGLTCLAVTPSKTVQDSVKSVGGWQPKAALVRALLTAGLDRGADGLIALLDGETSTRILSDCSEALAFLGGTDLGTDAAAWKRWWDANRDKRGPRKPATTRYGVGRFYGISIPPGKIAFVIDTSGSMREPVVGGPAAKWIAEAPHLKGKAIKSRLDLAIEELTHALATLSRASTVGVIAYSEAAQWVSKGFEPLDPALRDKLMSKVRALNAARKTNIFDGLWLAFHPNKKLAQADSVDGPDTIFLLSDGNPSVGKIEDIQELRDEVLAWNLGRSIKIHCVNVGDADARLLKALASSSGGTYLDLKSDRATPPDEEQKK